ncbi:hypothetical protein ACFV1W_31405 [Kitasatospora sp. NPDC059648]|uniref:hypothetical protein n=1 Tax=Kitasatospora sp. NPDC059648 TaxID=3346894 RepID=UPI0036B52F0E
MEDDQLLVGQETGGGLGDVLSGGAGLGLTGAQRVMWAQVSHSLPSRNFQANNTLLALGAITQNLLRAAGVRRDLPRDGHHRDLARPPDSRPIPNRPLGPVG